MELDVPLAPVRYAFLALCVASLAALFSHDTQAQPACNSGQIKDALERGDKLRNEGRLQAAREQYELASKGISKCTIDINLAYDVYAALAEVLDTLKDYNAALFYSVTASDMALRALKAGAKDQEVWFARIAGTALHTLYLQRVLDGPGSMDVKIFDVVAQCLLVERTNPELKRVWSDFDQEFRDLVAAAISDALSRLLSHFKANNQEVGGSEGLEHLVVLYRRLVKLSRAADRVLPRGFEGVSGRRSSATVSAIAVQLARYLIAKGERSEPESLVAEALAADPDHLHAKLVSAHLLAYGGQVDKALALHRLYRNREGWKVLAETDLHLFESFGQAQPWFRQVRDLLR